MKNIYYTLWADCFIKIKSNPRSKNIWKFSSFISMSLGMVFNFVVFISILQRNVLHCYFYKINLSFIHNEFIKFSLSGLILFFLPLFFLNYILVFKNNQYEKIMKEYKTYKGNLFLSYILISCFGPIVIGALIYWIERLFS